MTQAAAALLLSVGTAVVAVGQVDAPADATASAEVIARAESEAVVAWVERSALPDGRASFVAVARPTSADYAGSDYAYTFSVAAADSPTAEVQTGAFTTAPAGATAFAVERLRLGRGDSASVRLVLTDADGAVALDLRTAPPAVSVTETPPTREEVAATARPASSPVTSPPALRAAAVAPELEIDGLIIDETRTKLGRDFYDLFYGQWEPPAGARNYSITLTESPARGRTVRLTVAVDDRAVFRRMLQPRLELLEQYATQAATAVGRHLTQRSRISQQIDLEDRSASGI